MLQELHISNLAVISDARIELSRGLNCFTGATGAGKSLIIGAMEVLLGMRNPSEMLRTGVDEGRVSGVFELRGDAILKQLESITDAPIGADGGELLVTRRLFSSGRTSATLNGHPITLAMLRQVAELLVDVHGQHEHQYLLKPSNQLEVLDQFGNLWPLRERYHGMFSRLQDVRRKLDELDATRALRRQQLELYRFQADEIDAAQLEPGEMDELTSRAAVLSNLEKLKKEAAAAHAALYAVDGAVLERLKMIAAILSELADVDSNLKSISQNARDATVQLDEVAFDLGRYIDHLDLDPAELVEVNDRLNVVNRLLSKYGDSTSATLSYRAEIGAKIKTLESAGDDQSTLSKEIETLSKELQTFGDELSKKRRTAATKLAPLIETQLADLGMEKSKFTISLEKLGPPKAGPSAPGSIGAGPSGFDTIEFIIQTNPGLAPQPLRKIASGGELSRVMLALKGVLAQGDRVSVLVFDEIDANIGGRLGAVIGSKLRALAGQHQVICITHLAQIASFAERHLTVRKETDRGQTRTTVRPVDGEERLDELAEMIGGKKVTPTTLAQARELLDSAHAEFANSPPAKPGRATRVKA